MRYKVAIKRSASRVEIICPDWEKVQKIITNVFADANNDASISVEAIEEENE